MTTEADPTGRVPGDPGCKLDAGKVRMGLVMSGFSKALVEVGIVGTYGAELHGDRSWESTPDGAARYSDAMLRHWFDEDGIGGGRDEKSGLLHAACVAWNALARLKFILEDMEKKPSGGGGPVDPDYFIRKHFGNEYAGPKSKSMDDWMIDKLSQLVEFNQKYNFKEK